MLKVFFCYLGLLGLIAPAYVDGPVASGSPLAGASVHADEHARLVDGASGLEGWTQVFSGNLGGATVGTMAELLEAARSGAAVAVQIPTFHGDVVAVCAESYETTDGDLGCEVEFWCDGPAQDVIPAHHKHIAVVRSAGEVQQSVVSLNDRNEEKIAEVRYTTGALSWYVR